MTFLAYGTTQRQKSRFVFHGTLSIAAVGMFFVWLPDRANDLAALLGVGRGADLILYCWILTSLIVVLNLHLLIRANLQLTTELARQLALSHPLKPPEQACSRSVATLAVRSTVVDDKKAPPPGTAPD
jgi:hypothetical protein